jgi:FkbM family methyltransferase
MKSRLLFLFKNHDLNIFEKLCIIPSRNAYYKSHPVILKKLFYRNHSQEFFNISGYKIFFDPGYEVHNRDLFLKGICLVLAETFFFPNYFYRNVRPKKGDIVFDIGANIGTTSLLFSKYVGKSGMVYAFEPVTWKAIEKNLIENNISNIKVIPKGVSDASYETEIEISDFCVDSSICKAHNNYSSKQKIKVISLDDFIKDLNLEKIDFINMDIEGAEELALRGSKMLIEKYHPKWSISSYHFDQQNQPQHIKLVMLLKEYGYIIKEIESSHIYAW